MSFGVIVPSPLGSSIDSSEITDGAIVNADINASAAIADTKISFNAGVTTNGQVGITAPGSPGWVLTEVTCATNRAYFARVVPKRNMAITKIRFVTTLAATNNDACDVAIYSSDLQTRLVSAGATSAIMNATAGPQSITVASTNLIAGTTYYLAFSYGAVGGTAAKLIHAEYTKANAAAIYGNAVGAQEIFIKAASHPLPTSISSPDATAIEAVVLAACES